MAGLGHTPGVNVVHTALDRSDTGTTARTNINTVGQSDAPMYALMCTRVNVIHAGRRAQHLMGGIAQIANPIDNTSSLRRHDPGFTTGNDGRIGAG
jgi:hypothetical protein